MSASQPSERSLLRGRHNLRQAKMVPFATHSFRAELSPTSATGKTRADCRFPPHGTCGWITVDKEHVRGVPILTGLAGGCLRPLQTSSRGLLLGLRRLYPE